MGGHETLTIGEEAYRRLAEVKQNGESFTDVIIRPTEGRICLSKHSGAWKDVDDSEVKRVLGEIEGVWHKGWPS
ncbi:antitoxin VapB family protein [Candidatus Bathyarchaeota archaeon]|nr:antitoxin VapB family protein [Candidatus Bathyarchaeota archaeon]MBS7629117.1 antitoxin VapB family protein [Candidatus Bathyarchaeota archaeon]